MLSASQRLEAAKPEEFVSEYSQGLEIQRNSKEIPMKFHLISPNSGGDKSLSDASELEGEVMERAISGQLGAVCASPPSQPLAPAEQILDDFPALEDAVAEAALTP